MKKFVSILVGLMSLPLFALAASYDATLSNSGAQITIGSNTFVLSGKESLMDKIVVSNTDMVITTTAGVFFQLTSADKLDFTVSPAQYKTRFECQGSQSVLTVEASQNTSDTITITPKSACSGDSGGGGGGGGGGSGGGGSAAPAPAFAVATPMAPLVAQPSPIAQAVSPVFNKDLVRGARNDDVKRVQQLLARDKSVYPEGLATGLFGPATERAVRNFQLKYGVIKSATALGNGKLGPKTRAKLQEVFGGVMPAPAPVPAPAPAPAVAPAPSTGSQQSQIQQLLDQVKALQDQLNKPKTAPAPVAPPTPTKQQSPVPFFIGT